MPTTLEQAVEAHKAGKLEQAEALYRAILKDQPRHPAANHNLGVLASSVNKSADALLLLRTALEANPKQGSYWISYIDALIKDHQLETARLVLEQGKEMGLSGEQVDALSQQLALQSDEPESYKAQSPTFTQQRKKYSAMKEKKKNASSSQRNPVHASGPSQAEVNILLAQYESGHYVVAEKLAAAMTQKYPSHQFGWKVLGEALLQLSRLSEALTASQKAVALVPNDSIAHSNLGNLLNTLGRSEEAEASCRKAVELDPGLEEAHTNLGNALMHMGRLENAEESYKKAIAINPNLLSANYNLGLVLKKVGKLDEAVASYGRAIALKPNFASVHSDLGITLRDLGRLEDAEARYRQAITLKPD